MFGSKLKLGVVLSRHAVEAALVRSRTGQMRGKTLFHARHGGDDDLLVAGSEAALRSAFGALSRGLPRAARRADIPMNVAIPDALVAEDVFRFSDFPEDQRHALDLVRARVAREHGCEPAARVCSLDLVNRTDGQVQVRSRSMERDLRDRIEHSARAAGFHAARIDGWAGYISRALPEATAPATYLWSDEESWCLLCAGGQDPIGFSDSGWIDGREDAVARRALRVSHSFARTANTAPALAADPVSLVTGLSRLGSTGIEPVDTSDLAGGTRNPAAQIAIWA